MAWRVWQIDAAEARLNVTSNMTLRCHQTWLFGKSPINGVLTGKNIYKGGNLHGNVWLQEGNSPNFMGNGWASMGQEMIIAGEVRVGGAHLTGWQANFRKSWVELPAISRDLNFHIQDIQLPDLWETAVCPSWQILAAGFGSQCNPVPSSPVSQKMSLGVGCQDVHLGESWVSVSMDLYTIPSSTRWLVHASFGLSYRGSGAPWPRRGRAPGRRTSMSQDRFGEKRSFSCSSHVSALKRFSLFWMPNE